MSYFSDPTPEEARRLRAVGAWLVLANIVALFALAVIVSVTE